MYISRIKLQNWKNFQSVDVAVTTRCFIVGANAAGKSNLLDAFRFLHDLVRVGGGLQVAVKERGGFTKIRCLAARVHKDVLVEVVLSDSASQKAQWSYRLSFKHTGGGIIDNAVEITCEQVRNEATGEIILSRDGNSEKGDKEALKYTHLEQISSNKKFREIKDFFAAISYQNILPQLVRESGYSGFTSGDDHYGRDFLQRLSRLNEPTKKSYLSKISEVLQEAVPQLSELTYEKSADSVPHLKARYKHWRAQGSWQQETQFSDGTIRLIGFMFALLDNKDGVVLLEEPETNLHSAVVAKLPAFISKIQRTGSRKCQVIITTHSYDILTDAGIAGEETLLLMPSREGTEVTAVSDDLQMRTELEAGASIADCVMHLTAPDQVDNIMNVSF